MEKESVLSSRVKIGELLMEKDYTEKELVDMYKEVLSDYPNLATHFLTVLGNSQVLTSSLISSLTSVKRPTFSLEESFNLRSEITRDYSIELLKKWGVELMKDGRLLFYADEEQCKELEWLGVGRMRSSELSTNISTLRNYTKGNKYFKKVFIKPETISYLLKFTIDEYKEVYIVDVVTTEIPEISEKIYNTRLYRNFL